MPYLMLAGNLVAGWQLGRALLVAEQRLADGDDADFMRAKIAVAWFYGEHVLPRTGALRDSIIAGGPAVQAMATDAF